MRRLWVDTDIFCKLGIAGLLEPAVAIFDVTLAECGCLPALQYMLRRGRLPKLFGAQACETLVPVAASMSTPLPTTPSLDKFAKVDRIDVGEAQLLAIVADLGVIALTGDKRALVAAANVPDLPRIPPGKIVTLEAVLIALCEKLGDEVVRAAVQQGFEKDAAIRMCFSAGNNDPRAGLRSYFGALKRDVVPLELWEPDERKP